MSLFDYENISDLPEIEPGKLRGILKENRVEFLRYWKRLSSPGLKAFWGFLWMEDLGTRATEGRWNNLSASPFPLLVTVTSLIIFASSFPWLLLCRKQSEILEHDIALKNEKTGHNLLKQQTHILWISAARKMSIEPARWATVILDASVACNSFICHSGQNQLKCFQPLPLFKTLEPWGSKFSEEDLQLAYVNLISLAYVQFSPCTVMEWISEEPPLLRYAHLRRWRGELMVTYNSSKGAKGQWQNPRKWHGAVPGEGHAGCLEKVLHQRVVSMEQAVVTALSCWSSGSVWAAYSDIGFKFGVVLYGVRSWNQGSLWIFPTWDIVFSVQICGKWGKESTGKITLQAFTLTQ